ncbi:mechanosensitive ion channel family protein, partial [Candidatus Woesearchaeota archaeon]|nr:mechanosensitive ion channel family protein [Candidatus Woesearchaeota archaeon]
QILQMQVIGNTGRDYFHALLIFAVSFIMLKIFKSYLIHILKKAAKKTKTSADDMFIDFLGEIHWPFFVYVSIFIATKTLALPKIANDILRYLLVIAIVFYAVKGLQKVIDYIAEREIKKRTEEDAAEDTSFILILGKIVKFFIWVIALLLVLSNLGVNITPLITGLGIGGIAIAFALQNILEDLFSSFTIYFDKPFKKGDIILIGQDRGEVKHIGLKTTRIQTLEGEELIVSNRELTNTRIRNLKRMEKRRVVFTLGVEYATNLKKLKSINNIIANIIKKIDKIEFERVHFKEFGDFSLIYEIVYYVNDKDVKTYMDIQERINFAIKEKFEKEGIQIAFPTQIIHVKKD